MFYMCIYILSTCIKTSNWKLFIIGFKQLEYYVPCSFLHVSLWFNFVDFLEYVGSHQIWKYFYHCFLKYFLPMSLLSFGDSNSTFSRPVEVVSRLIEALFHFSTCVFALYFKIRIIYIILLSFQPSMETAASLCFSGLPILYLHLRWPLGVLSCVLGNTPGNKLEQSEG